MSPIADLIASNRFKVSLGKQSAEGTAQTTSDYQIPVYASSLKPMEERNDYEVIQGDAFRPGQYKSRAWGEGTIEWASFPDSAGRVITSHFGLDTKTGAGDPYTHTITNNNSPHWATIYQARPLAGTSFEYDQYKDCLIKTCDIVYESGQMPRLVTDVIAKTVTTKATTPTITTTNTLDSAAQKYNFVAPTLKIDYSVTPAVTSRATMTSFTAHFGYDDAEFVNTQNINPDYRNIGLWSVGFNGEMLLSDYDLFYTTFFGALAPGANTAQSAVTVRGSVDATLNIGPPADANRTLQIQMPSVLLSMEAPEPSADGSGLRVALSGVLEKPTSGEPVTIVLKNSVATAY